MASNNATGDKMTIGQLAKAVHKTPRALRLYEQKGLIHPDSRSQGGFRLYGLSALSRLEWILRLSELGLSLDEIQSMLEEIGAAENGDTAMAVLREEYHRRVAEVSAQIERLEALRQGLKAGLRYMERCRGCGRTELPKSCAKCIAEVGDDLPASIGGLLAQPPIDRRDPCRRIGGKNNR